jgi:hypothetical protein
VAFTLLDETRAVPVDATVAADGVRLPPAVVHEALGWELKPQGLCKDDTCIPVPPAAALVRGGAIDLATLADLLGRPLALDAAEHAACLGVAATDRARTLASLDAPDFTLPDLDGQPHTLSAYRGKKVFLIAFASW